MSPATCDRCDRPMIRNGGCITHRNVYRHGADPFFENHPELAGFPCHDCGAAWGSYHHSGCDSERCTICYEQTMFAHPHFELWRRFA